MKRNKHWCSPDFFHEGTWDHPVKTHYRIIRCSGCGKITVINFCREGEDSLYFIEPVPLGLTILDYFDWSMRS